MNEGACQVTFGSTHPGEELPNNDGWISTSTQLKSNHWRRPSSLPICHDTGCTRRRIILVLLALAGAILFVNFLWGRHSKLQDELEYVVVIDCGSTGTRVHVYGWTREGGSGKGSIPKVVHPSVKGTGAELNHGAPTLDEKNRQGSGRAYKRMETEPGLHKLLHNESGVTHAITPLIHWAAKQIPQSVHSKTKLFFLATAGLRKLPLVDSEWLLDRAYFSLLKSPFMCRKEWVRVITGQEEAYFGWIALNHNLERLGPTPRKPTIGSLDLGGSSLEIAFEPEEIPRSEYLVNVNVGSLEHRLYAYSHPGFGLNDAFEKSVALLLERGGKDSSRVPHPCLNAGYVRPFTCSSQCHLPPFVYTGEPLKGQRTLTAQDVGSKIELIGKPNWAECQSLIQSVINMSGLTQTSGFEDCDESTCALGKYQPQTQGKFLALAGFFVVYKFFGLTPANSLDDLLHRGQQFCKLKWEEAEQSVAMQPNIDRYCFRAPYVAGLLRGGLHLSDEQIMIGSGDFAWTLGAALSEAGALLPANLKGGQGNGFLHAREFGLPLDVYSLAVFFVVLFLVILLLTCSCKWIPSSSWHRPYLPLFVPSLNSGRTFSWIPAAFRSQVLPGINPSALAVQSSEGRLKHPQSPAPCAPKSNFQHQMFGSRPNGIKLVECDVLQLSGAGISSAGSRSQIHLPSYVMQHKGGSRLQSRRTQSQEDFSSYISPYNPHLSKV